MNQCQYKQRNNFGMMGDFNVVMNGRHERQQYLFNQAVHGYIIEVIH